MIFAEPCGKNPADLYRFAKIENLGSDDLYCWSIQLVLELWKAYVETCTFERDGTFGKEVSDVVYGIVGCGEWVAYGLTGLQLSYSRYSFDQRTHICKDW